MTMKTMMVFEEVFNDGEDIFLNIFDDCVFFDDGEGLFQKVVDNVLKC